MTRTGIATILLGGLCVGLLSIHVTAQQRQPDAAAPGAPGATSDAGQPVPMIGPPPPATRLEGLAAQKGLLIIKGYTDIGDVQADDGARLRVMAVTFTDAKQNREQGLVISVEQRDQTPVVTYVDAEEMDPLSDALDQLAKLENNSSPMANAEGVFHTRGDLEFTNHASNGSRVVTVRATLVLIPSGQVLQAAATFRPARLGEIRQQMATAKEALDRARSQAPSAAPTK
jgi:hypothetical protein